MVNVDSRVHALSQVDGASTRFRIYFYDGDCTNDTLVRTNGTLLKQENTDTDSNSRISGESGVRITEYFCKEDDIEIGRSVSSQISMSLLNFDGGLNSFEYGKCKVYLDIMDSASNTWLPCPMGVYYVEKPTKRKKSLISITAYDCMAELEKYADEWWYSENLFSSSTTLYSLASSLAEYCGFHLSAASANAFLNGTLSVSEVPFSCSKDTTYRDILDKIAECAGCNVRFDRNGYIDFFFLNETGITINASSNPTVVMGIDVSEYETEKIDYVEINDTYLSINASYGNGNNIYKIADNEFISTGNIETMIPIGQPIADRLFGIDGFYPISMSLIADYSIQAGDVVSVSYGGETYKLPIYCNEMAFGGSWCLAQYSNSGNVQRATGTKSSRANTKIEKTVHSMTNTVDTFASRFESTDESLSELSQNIDGLSATVASQNSRIDAKLDSSAFELSFQDLSNRVSQNAESVMSKVSIEEFTKYIRFVDGKIILGNTASEIKLKIENDILYFYTGSDASPIILAYFSNNEMYVANISTENHLQIGTDSDGVNWQFVKDTDGDLLLRMV